MLYGQVRDEFRRGRYERPEVEAKRVAELDVDVFVTRQPLGEMRLERAVELDGMNARDSLGEVRSQDAQPGADLEHHVVVVEHGEAVDHAEDVLVDEEVLAEIAIGSDRKAHGSEKAAVAFVSIRVPSSSASSPRASASAATVSRTFAGSLGRPRRA